MIETEAARLSRLVDDLLDLSRIEADAVNPHPDWCDLRDVVVERGGPGAGRARRPPDRVRAACGPAARARGSRSARARVREPDRERGQVLAARRRRCASAAASAADRVIGAGDRPRAGASRAPSAARIFEPFVRGRDAGPRVRARPRDLPRLRRGERRADRAAGRHRRRDVVRRLVPARRRQPALDMSDGAHVLVVDDEPQIVRGPEGGPAQGRLRGRDRGDEAGGARRGLGSAAGRDGARPRAAGRQRRRRLRRGARLEPAADHRAVGGRRRAREGAGRSTPAPTTT